MEFSIAFTIFTYMKIRETDNQLYLEHTDRIFKGKELALQIVGSGLGVLSLNEGTLIVVEFSKMICVIFQLKKTLKVTDLNDYSYIDYLAGSAISIRTGKPIEKIAYAPTFRYCRLPTMSEVERYEKSTTI